MNFNPGAIMTTHKAKKIKEKAWNIGNAETPCYITVLNAKEVFDMSTVSRVEDNPKLGYQRNLDEKRVNNIAQYLEQGNIIPGSIILSAQSNSEILFDENTQEISMSGVQNSLFVIDGQHRLWGASKAELEVKLPVCIFVGLSMQQEVQYFLDINSNQKGVPKTLRIELLKFLSEPDSNDAILNKMFEELGESPSSALFNKTSPTTSKPGKITHVPFRNALESLLDGKVLKKFDYNGKRNLIENYINAFSRVLISLEGNDKRLTQSAFFQAMFKIFDEVCEYSLSYYKNYKQESFENSIEGIKNVDFEKHSGSNQQTISALENDMKNAIELYMKRNSMPSDLL